MNNLITFGSQHMGVSDLPICGPRDLLCQIARRTAKRAVYGNWAQNNIIQVSLTARPVHQLLTPILQAQYFRDPSNIDAYLATNHFLTSINNELPDSRNDTYARRLATLNKLVLVIFTEDQTVVPKESAWFGSEAIQENFGSEQIPMGLADKTIIPMRLQPLYREDWIGLRELDERGDVVLDVCQGEHMQIGECWERLVREYAGGLWV